MAQLCLLEDIRVRLGKASMTVAESGSHTALIADASDYAETYCDRTFLSGSLATDTWKGLGYNSRLDLIHDAHTSKERPICGTPALEYWTGTAWTAVTATWEVDPTSTYIYFTDGSYFVEDAFYRLRYAYGYTLGTYGGGNLLKDLRGAVARHVIWLYNTAKHLGTLSNSSADGRSYTYAPSVPKDILAVYDRYKR